MRGKSGHSQPEMTSAEVTSVQVRVYFIIKITVWSFVCLLFACQCAQSPEHRGSWDCCGGLICEAGRVVTLCSGLILMASVLMNQNPETAARNWPTVFFNWPKALQSVRKAFIIANLSVDFPVMQLNSICQWTPTPVLNPTMQCFIFSNFFFISSNF